MVCVLPGLVGLYGGGGGCVCVLYTPCLYTLPPLCNDGVCEAGLPC